MNEERQQNWQRRGCGKLENFVGWRRLSDMDIPGSMQVWNFMYKTGENSVEWKGGVDWYPTGGSFLDGHLSFLVKSVWASG